MKVVTGSGHICMLYKHIKGGSGCCRGQWLPGAALALGWPWAPTAKPPTGGMHLKPIHRVLWKLNLTQPSLQQILQKQCYTAAVPLLILHDILELCLLNLVEQPRVDVLHPKSVDFKGQNSLKWWAENFFFERETQRYETTCSRSHGR